MRNLMTLALLPAGAVAAQLILASTRIESAELTCRNFSSAVRLSDTRADKAPEACPSGALVAPGQVFEMRPNGYRIGAAVRVAVDPAPTPDRAPDPVSNLAGVPLSFDDPVYANVKSGTSRIMLSSGSSRTDLSIVENSGEPTITCDGSCSLTRVRIQSREGVRCLGGDINLTWVYITATGIDSDHADGLQCYAPGSTGTVTVTNSTFKMAGATTAGYFSADNWHGSHVFENVLFEGGNHGLRIPADGGSSVSLKNVYFVHGSFRYGPFLFDVVKGQRIKIAQWENVRWASWNGDQLVLGEFIPRP
ncbi:hypothetical protein [Bradyrhizobium cenepequi]|uniref:hypothetical protein n=1 Tax=Bradyrhizobium cenepequi TaxID=2821403 RepID=UPI001CE3A790|nr:hypothetical protein [Bradyrhizobium cenepequi]MCA6107154.1 hypothetical protein [Bradyrhizobium cenepequi]